MKKMVSIKALKYGIGFGFKGFGFFWGLFNRFLCDFFCEKGACTRGDNITCSLLFLFVGIVFIICGYSIVTLPPKKRKKIKKILGI